MAKEDEDKLFLINNEIEILKGIQERKKKALHAQQQKNKVKNNILNIVNREKSKILS